MKKIITFLMSLFVSFSAKAQLKIDVWGGYSEPMPVAIAPFYGVSLAEDVRQIIINNLQETGLFRIVDEASVVSEAQDVRLEPNFSDWQRINAQVLLFANVENNQDGALKISFRLWDVFGQYKMLGQALTLPAKDGSGCRTPQVLRHFLLSRRFHVLRRESECCFCGHLCVL